MLLGQISILSIGFLLYFENLQSNITREDYLRKLDEHFKKLGLGGYRKNRPDLFSVLTKHGNLNLATRWAKKRMDEHAGKTPSQSVPATRVHVLVLELMRYISEDN